jgi:pimeloyl-ACP methyl ester carboxylesterase
VDYQSGTDLARLDTSLSTNNIACDLDALRRALDERQITYVGLSYGIRYQGGGHGAAASGNGRIADVLVKYLFDLTIPAEGFSCPGQPIQFGAPAAQKGIDGKQVIEDLERDWLWKPSATRIRKGN